MFQQSLFNSKLNVYNYVKNTNQTLETECSRVVNRFISAYIAYYKNRQRYFGKNIYSIKMQYDYKNISKDNILNNYIVNSYSDTITNLDTNIIDNLLTKIRSEYFVIKINNKLVLELKQDVKERITKELKELCN